MEEVLLRKNRVERAFCEDGGGCSIRGGVLCSRVDERARRKERMCRKMAGKTMARDSGRAL